MPVPDDPADHNHAAWDADKQAWASSEKHAPAQPGLTRTCKALRALTLPLFYQENRFRAHYCNTADFATAERWLEAIGPRNRACLRRMWLFDENPKQDRHWPRDIEGEKETLRERFGAVLEPAVIDENVRHRVVLPGAL
ncbi:hypothetical protein LTR29_016506 [Friedmanniomyces endolithicus]|nr:hypothetical protein LTR29_016506 [Friedmanniomyces endolithicus]